MLTKHQIRLIDERKGGKNSEGRAGWKAGDYALRQHLKKQLDSMSDLLEIFEVLPDKQLGSTVTLNQISDVLKVIEKLMDIHPPVAVTRVSPEDTGRATQHFTINMGSHIRGLDNAVTGAEVSYLANDDEKEFWNEFYNVRRLFNDIWENLAHGPKKYTRKEFNDLMKKIIVNRKDVKISPEGWTVGTPKEDLREKKVDPGTDAKRKVVSLTHKKMLKEKAAQNKEHSK